MRLFLIKYWGAVTPEIMTEEETGEEGNYI